ncbi:MAG: RNA pyrophosphohydrolase [Alphaproteobacteria bacterium]|nr:RNA pyrophosphohydrolase [Alphaproteobacteria bacterium]
MTEKYRKNVGIIIFDIRGKVLMCARADKPDMQWQFPQGGIEPNEDIIEAAKRELKEETGITSVKYVNQLPFTVKYKFPDSVKNFFKQQGCDYVGQEQSWVLFLFEGNDCEINFLTNPEEIEFKDFEWVNPLEAPQRIVYFKKDVYQTVVNYFLPIIISEVQHGK